MHCGPNDPNGIDSNNNGVDFDLASCVLAAQAGDTARKNPTFSDGSDDRIELRTT